MEVRINMLGRFFLIFPVILITVWVEGEDGPETQRMLGLDATHDVTIDKDTVITRNLKLQKRTSGKKASPKIDEGREPDWSYNPIPQGVSADAEAFKRNMTECLKEVQKNDKRTATRLSPRMDSPVHGECLIACVLKRNGIIHNGKLHKQNLINLISKFYGKDTKLMKKLEKHVDRCIDQSARVKDECEMAARLNECTNGLMVHNKKVIPVNY